MSRISFVLLGLLLLTSCSSTKIIPGENNFQNNLNKINYLGSENESEIVLLDSTRFQCSHLEISRDSLSFINVENDSIYNISTNQLSKIIIKDNTASFMGGFWIGLSSATIVSIISSAKTGDYKLGTAIVVAIAAVVGYIYGSSYTGEKEFIFN
jgi:hypothetical protein